MNKILALSSVSSVGGWSFGTQKFKDVSATRYARQTFIYSAIPYLRDRNFDGLDIDWEYPKGGDDKKNYVLLLKGKDSLQKEQQQCKVPEIENVRRTPILIRRLLPIVLSFIELHTSSTYDATLDIFILRVRHTSRMSVTLQLEFIFRRFFP